MRITTTAGLSAAGLVLALGLVGCANPIERVLEEQLGAQVDTDGKGNMTIESDDGKVEIGVGTELPADFPADLPTPAGTLAAVVSGGGGWTLSYEGVERGEVEKLEAHFISSGFEEIVRVDAGTARQASFQGERWTVSLIWDGAADGSKALIYGVVSR